MLQQDKQMKEIKVQYLNISFPFANCKSEINNTEIDNAKDINVVTVIQKHPEFYGNITKMSQ